MKARPYRNAAKAIGTMLAVAGLLGAAPAAAAKPPARSSSARPLDLADQVAGRYFGSVISDARGSSRSDVRITIAKIGPNKVRISSDYARLPSFEAALSRYLQTIQNVGGDQVVLIDLSKSPVSLDLTVDDASWSGTRE